MKTIYKIPMALLFAIMVLIPYSCTDNFEEMNTNPKLVTDELIKPGLLLTKVLKESCFEIQNVSSIGEFSGFSSRQDSGQPLSFRNYDQPFINNYTRHIVNMSAIIRLTADDPVLANMNAIAKIWKVWVFHRLTDAYGDLPYFDTSKAFEDIILSPKYDTQEIIYTDLLNELKEAAAQLNITDPSQEGYGAADVLFGSDVDSWKRLANSLRLRLAMRVRFADQALAQTHITDVLSSDMIAVNDQNATVTSEGAGAPDIDNTNPLYKAFENGNAGAGNSMVVGLPVWEGLEYTSDPRKAVYFRPDDTVTYVGRAINMNVAEGQAYAPVARLTLAFAQAEYDFNVLTASEVHFLRSEAALAGLSSENANGHFRQGITSSMEQRGVAAGDIAIFLASAAGTLTGSAEEQLEQIIVQKYIALFGDPYEAWAEHRRTGYPKMWIGSLAAPDTDQAMPRRLAYPLVEYQVNGEMIQEAIGRLEGGDQMDSRVWWDAKAGTPIAHPLQGTFPPYL